jgi:hypothetical protein
MRFFFIQFVNSVAENLTNKDFTQQLTPEEINFLNTLIKDNIQLLNTVYDSIKQFETNGIINLHDLIHVVHIIITLFRVHLLENKITNVSLFNIVRFIAETLTANSILSFPEGIHYDEVKIVLRTTLQILNINPKIKPVNFIIKFLKSLFKI